jgi:hypothetical protein
MPNYKTRLSIATPSRLHITCPSKPTSSNNETRRTPGIHAIRQMRRKPSLPGTDNVLVMTDGVYKRVCDGADGLQVVRIAEQYHCEVLAISGPLKRVELTGYDLGSYGGGQLRCCVVDELGALAAGEGSVSEFFFHASHPRIFI